MNSPFQYGTLAMGAAFVNRVAEKQQLKQHLMAGINVMLISPRRWGKSSLVMEAMTELTKQEPKVVVCYIDAMTILSETGFYETFAREIIKATSNGMESWISSVKQYLSAISPRITLGADPMSEFSLNFDLRALKENELDILNLPDKIAKKKGIRIIICIDEFQNLANLQSYGQLEKNMRSVWQKQEHVSYCMYGSKRHMMIDIFNSSSKPFYRFGQILFLEKIAQAEWVKYIIKQFKNTEKEIAEQEAAYLVSLVESHSWYVQQLAHFVWINTPLKVTKEIIDLSINQVITTNKPMFQSECDSLSPSQLSLLKAIANGQKELTGTEAMQEYSLGTPQNVVKNKKTLIKKDLIDQTGRDYTFVDPVFKMWFKKTY